MYYCYMEQSIQVKLGRGISCIHILPVTLDYFYFIKFSTGILTRLSENGYNVVAIDLPGYGGTESLKYDHLHQVILEKIIASLSLDRPAIISPSFSGLYSIDYILRNPKGLLAFIPVAPVFPENFGNLSSESLDTIASVQSIPAFVVWGSKDSPGKKRSRHLLTIFKKGISFEIEGASHPCYLDEPDMFSRAVTSYLNNEVMIARAGAVVTNES